VRRMSVWILAALAGVMAIALAVSAEPGVPAIRDPLRRQKSRVLEEKPEPVLDVHGEYVVRGFKVHNASLRAMLNTGVKKLTGQPDSRTAWRQIIHDEDVIALVFSPIGGKELGTNRDFAAAMLLTLYEAGFKPEQIMLVGLDELPAEAEGTRPCRYGWQNKPVEIGSDSVILAKWLEEVTAILNIPLLMDDNAIGLRGAIANLTWPLIKSPARFNRYDTQGDPFLAEIYNLPAIRGKVRLHIANTLRILYCGGPIVNQRYVWEYGTAMFSMDPVALDTIGVKLICRARREFLMPEGAPESIAAPYLDTAQAMGLGYADLNFIDYDYFKHEKLK